MTKTQIRPEFDAMDDRALRQFIADNPAHVSEDDPMGTHAELLDTAKLVADRMSEDQPRDIQSMEKITTSREELEFSLGWIENNAGLFAKQIREFHEKHSDGWMVTTNERPGLLTVIAERVERSKSGWLRSGSLLYRLTNTPRPENCDEINVAMADGSREAGPREARTLQLMALLEHEESLKQALRWALDWIDAVPDDMMLPGMPGFDRDYVNGLLEGPDGTVE